MTFAVLTLSWGFATTSSNYSQSKSANKALITQAVKADFLGRCLNLPQLRPGLQRTPTDRPASTQVQQLPSPVECFGTLCSTDTGHANAAKLEFSGVWLGDCHDSTAFRKDDSFDVMWQRYLDRTRRVTQYDPLGLTIGGYRMLLPETMKTVKCAACHSEEHAGGAMMRAEARTEDCSDLNRNAS